MIFKALFQIDLADWEEELIAASCLAEKELPIDFFSEESGSRMEHTFQELRKFSRHLRRELACEVLLGAARSDHRLSVADGESDGE